MSDLRDHLFTALEDLNEVDESGKPVVNPDAVNKAIAVAKIGTVIVNTVKAELTFHKMKKGFMDQGESAPMSDFIEGGNVKELSK